jgi:predicted amidohydrolase YtcJ
VPYSLVEVYRRFRGACCLHNQGDEAVRTSGTSVNFCQTTRHNNPEDGHLQENIPLKIRHTFQVNPDEIERLDYNSVIMFICPKNLMSSRLLYDLQM